jgi:CheY-like chemotaxis protein
MSAIATPIKIMLVDDNRADIELTKDILAESKIRLSIIEAMDGQQALEYLEARLLSREELPDLILLDLNMPRLDGRGLLSKMRGREEFKALPVVVLTSSDAEQDIISSYKLGANCYVNKPVGLDEFQKIVRSIECFWLTIVKLP